MFIYCFSEHKDIVKVAGPLHTMITSLKAEADKVCIVKKNIFSCLIFCVLLDFGKLYKLQ